MTLRTIEPIDIRGLSPRQPATGMPIFDEVDPRTLVVDPAYQRTPSDRSMRQIRRIVEGFDWTRFKPPVCALSDEDGQTVLKVIDGQHTAIAAASNPFVSTIPVMIVEAPDTRAQANAFIGQNTDRLQITAAQMHVAAVTAGDEHAVAIDHMCADLGIRVLRNPPGNGAYKANDTIAVAAIATLMKREPAEHVRQVLTILAGIDLAPIKADHIKAVDRLLTEAEFGALDVAALAPSIAAYPAAMKDAAAFAATHSVPLWKALAAVWFQKAKKRKPGSGSAVVPPQPGALLALAPPASGSGLALAPLEAHGDLAADLRPARGAWSPGNHVRRCVKCDGRFRGGRLAMECAGCAYGGANG